MKILSSVLFLIIFQLSIDAEMFHHKAPLQDTWRMEDLKPFDELILSWNARRQVKGTLHFYIRVKIDEWSPWFLYASWGSNGQSSFQSNPKGSFVKVYQDALEVQEGKKASGFQIRLEGNSVLSSVHGLHVYTNGDQGLQTLNACLNSCYLKVPGISQMTLNHIRHADMCSPTATTAVIRYLSNNEGIDPIHFACRVLDSGFNIYGNWVFNVAEAAVELGANWDCWVERLIGFDRIYKQLEQGIAVVVSVKGPLAGSASPYAKGHLLVVTGYDSIKKQVICMDPAFPTDLETHVSYDLSDFIKAWGRRGNVAYMFSKK